MSEIRLFKASNSELPDETRLWRYVPLKTLFAYLAGNVFIPSIETLQKQDPFEGEHYIGLFSSAFGEAIRTWYGADQAEALIDFLCKNGAALPKATDGRLKEIGAREAYFRHLDAMRFAWCWFADSENCESAAMWNLYGKDGAAVATTVGKLTRALATCDQEFEFGRMTYVRTAQGNTLTEPRSIGPELLLRPYFLKRAEYSSEREVRFVTSGPEMKWGGGIELSLSPMDWITEIRLSPTFAGSEEHGVREAIKKLVPSWRGQCTRSKLLRRDEAEILSFVGDRTSANDLPSELKLLLQLWPRESGGCSGRSTSALSLNPYAPYSPQ